MPAPLTTKTAIGGALKYFEGLTQDDLANSKNRSQLLILLQGIMDELENERDLKFLYKTETITVLQGTSSIALPTDFKEIGEEGSVWIPALNREVIGPKQQQEVLRERLRGSSSPKEVEIYGLWDSLFQTVVAPVDTVIDLYYVRTPTALQDSSDISEAGIDNSTVFLLPSHYHYSVLMPGLLSRSNIVKDELKQTMAEVYERNKAKMYVRERARRGDIEMFPEYEGVQH